MKNANRELELQEATPEELKSVVYFFIMTVTLVSAILVTAVVLSIKWIL